MASLHASRLRGPPAPQIGIVIEPTPATQISSLLLSAYGLTDAQSRVVALVIRGHSTRQIVQELHFRRKLHLMRIRDRVRVWRLPGTETRCDLPAQQPSVSGEANG